MAMSTDRALKPSSPSPSPQLATPIVQLLASATRSAHHRPTLFSYFPPAERIAARAAKPKNRGWEKMASPTSPTASPPGASVTSPIAGGNGGWGKGGGGGGVGSTAGWGGCRLGREASLLALVALAKKTASVAVLLARGMVYQPDLFGLPLALIHTLTRSRNLDVRLAACLCATHILCASRAS
ncbi:hypothetical protein DFP72DRAFT_1067387 [Ephemerocybe angulata]|uniref:Uncharacterized protein n=1 Tax=Ephemerocybe angulata TaxID=980116 RepID=A0A8H6I1C1_9AGAR|nr:hypothetical protein DFP72DRAFT_1067387 [Tulosesus angulatus]